MPQLSTKAAIIRLIQDDPEMMEILHTVEQLSLPDWCICGGFIKNKIWDHLHLNSKRTHPRDIDVMLFDPSNPAAGETAKVKLNHLAAMLNWDVTNQAFTHLENNDEPYVDTLDALSKQPETVTAIGVRLAAGRLQLLAPYGIDDLVNCTIRPTPIFYEHPERKQIVIERLHEKKLLEKWPQLKVII